MVRNFIQGTLESHETTERKTNERRRHCSGEKTTVIDSFCDDPGTHQASDELGPFTQSAPCAQDEGCSKKHLSTVVGFSSFYGLILSSLGISALPPVTASLVPLLPFSFLPPFSFPSLGICMLIASVEMFACSFVFTAAPQRAHQLHSSSEQRLFQVTTQPQPLPGFVFIC